MQKIEASRLKQVFEPRSLPAIPVVSGRVRLDVEGCNARHREDRHAEHTLNRRGNAVRTQTPRRTRTALGTATLCLTVACGGGPTGALYDLIADASKNAEAALNNLENARGEVEEATSADLPPCAERYRRPEGMHPSPRYADSIPIPEGVDPGLNAMGESIRRITCNNTPRLLERIRAGYERTISSLTEFEVHADTMREAIDRMDDDAVEALVEEIEAIAAATPDEDTFTRRFQRLTERLVGRSRVVRIVGNEVEGQGLTFAMPVSADEAANVQEMVLVQIDALLREHEVARQYLQDLYDYRRQSYEGPDAGIEP